MKIYEPHGEHITVTAKNMVELSSENDEPVFAIFSGFGLVANPWTTMEEILKQWEIILPHVMMREFQDEKVSIKT